MRLYGDFEERGYRFRAYIPVEAADGNAFKVEILHADKPLHEFRVPMDYEPRYGADAGDVRRLEAITDAILKLLPAPAQFDRDTIGRIDAMVAELT
jgi:hypothetical protein